MKASEDLLPFSGGQPGRPQSKTAVAYEHYFSSGAYELRYPRPNPQVLDCIRRHLPRGGHVVDYGCGSGRYLFALRSHAGRVAGYDVCPAALKLLADHAAKAGWGELGILGPDPSALSRHSERCGPADVVLCLFGVLGHMPSRHERRMALRHMSRLVRPGTGRIVLSVPNRWRRFYLEQLRGRADGGIRYTRQMNGTPVEMRYQLFGPARLRLELADAGLKIESLAAESFFGESLVARSGVARALDRAICPRLPPSAGYGLLAVVAQNGGPAA